MEISGLSMRIKTTSKRAPAMLVILLVTLLVWLPSSPSFGASQATPYQVIELKGIELPVLLNKHFDKLTLFAVKQGILIPIPFQLEDYDSEGYSWFKESGNHLLGSENVLDEHDSLFFRYQDAGNKLDDYNAGFARISAEIAVKAPNSDEMRYVYVSDQFNGFIHKPLTEYNPQTGIVKSEHFSLNTNPNNFLIWNDFNYDGYSDGDAESLLDTLKIRVDAGVVLEGTRITLDNRNIKTKVVAIKRGPIRTVVLGTGYLSFASIPVVYLDLNFQIYPQQIRIGAKIEVPVILAQLLNTPHATISLDGKDLKGSELQVSHGSQQAVLVDGKMSAQEAALENIEIPRDQNWIWLTTHKGFDIIAQLFIPSNFQVPVSVYYIDDEKLEERPERFTGQGPNVGYHIHDLPIDDTFHFTFSLFFSDSIAPHSPDVFIESIASVPHVTTTGTADPQLAQQH